MKRIFSILCLAVVLVLTSCGDQHKAQSLVKDFLNENLKNNDCSFDRFTNISRTAMIDTKKVEELRNEAKKLPYVSSDIHYAGAGTVTDTLLYIRAYYTLTDKEGKDQKLTQTFYFDKALTQVVAFKEN